MIYKILSIGLMTLISLFIWKYSVDMKEIYYHFQKAYLEKYF